jgi:hypothetical protein
LVFSRYLGMSNATEEAKPALRPNSSFSRKIDGFPSVSPLRLHIAWVGFQLRMPLNRQAYRRSSTDDVAQESFAMCLITPVNARASLRWFEKAIAMALTEVEPSGPTGVRSAPMVTELVSGLEKRMLLFARHPPPSAIGCWPSPIRSIRPIRPNFEMQIAAAIAEKIGITKKQAVQTLDW